MPLGDAGDQAGSIHTAGQAAADAGGNIYQLSGWTVGVGDMRWRALIRLNLPSDFCGLHHNEQSCISHVGCAYCKVADTQQFFCHSKFGSRPSG